MEELTFEITEGPERGRLIPVLEPLVIGRSKQAQVVLNDEQVSRSHVKLTPVPGGLVVEDLDSRNGTFVNGDQIHGPAHLDVSDRLLVGVTVLLLRTSHEARSQPSAVRPIPTAFESPLPERPGAGAAEHAQDGRKPGLAKDASRPNFVPPGLVDEHRSELDPLLDTFTKGKARVAPIAIFVLMVIAAIILLSTR